MSYSLLIDCKQQNVVQISHGVMDLILIFFPQFSSKYPRFGEEFGRVGESPMTQIPSPICLLKPQIWGIPPETVTLLVLEMKYLQMLTFIQTYHKKFEFKVLSTSRWGTVETLKHDCLT